MTNDNSLNKSEELVVLTVGEPIVTVHVRMHHIQLAVLEEATITKYNGQGYHFLAKYGSMGE